MSRALRPPAAFAIVVLIGVISAGCGSNAPSDTGTANSAGAGSNKNTTDQDKGVKFSKCMRKNGVSEFPDPNASGELTIDEIANGSSLDTNSAAWKEAISACKDLEPPGFTGRKRSTEQQENALEFAQCMRDNGVKDFPDPTEAGPLIDTSAIPSAKGRGARSIPGFQAAVARCRDALAGALGRRR